MMMTMMLMTMIMIIIMIMMMRRSRKTARLLQGIAEDHGSCVAEETRALRHARTPSMFGSKEPVEEAREQESMVIPRGFDLGSCYGLCCS